MSTPIELPPDCSLGQKYGRFTVVGAAEKKRGTPHLLCRCACGSEKTVQWWNLKYGRTTGCGCGRLTAVRRVAIGGQFGLLTTIGDPKKVGNAWLFTCRCACGNTTTATASALLGSKKKSCGCLNVFPPQEAAFNRVLGSYIKNAEARGVAFDLTKEEVRALTRQDCYYCGDHPSNVKRVVGGNGNYVYMGIDRLVNTDGYHAGNVVPCCFFCNKAKGTHSVDNFLNRILRIARRHATHNISKLS